MAPVNAKNSSIPGAIPPKVGENLSEMRPTTVQNFTPIGKAPAEKSVTVHLKMKKATVNLVSRPILCVAGY